MIVWVNTIVNRTVVKLLTVTDTLTLKMTSAQVVETSVTTGSEISFLMWAPTGDQV